MALTQTHAEAATLTTPGARAAAFIRGFASHIQAACNNQDFGMIRELAVQASEMADDVALSVDHGHEKARSIREANAERVREAGAGGMPPVAPSVDTPRVTPAGAPHAGPTDYQAAPTPERDGVMEARPVSGERANSAPNSDKPGAGTASVKEKTGTPAGEPRDKTASVSAGSTARR